LTLALGLSAEAQQPEKIARVGFLGVSASRSADRTNSFRQGLRELGYAEGKNLAIEYRWADGIVERLPARAAELVALNLDVIVVSGGSAAIAAAQNATRKIPIIFSGSSDPVASGFVASLARPGGNLTGVTIGGPELYGKRLELFKEVVPSVRRVALLYNARGENPDHARRLGVVREVAPKLGLTLNEKPAKSVGDVDEMLRIVSKENSDGIFIICSGLFSESYKRINAVAIQKKLPAWGCSAEQSVEALLSYSPDRYRNGQRGAWYVDKILKGAKPGDLPVEQPTKFEFVINLKTAKQIGLAISMAQ